MPGNCVAVRDDGSYAGETIEELESAGLTAIVHPSWDDWLLIDPEGLHGSAPGDVDFELYSSGFTSRIQETRHGYLPVEGHPEDDECTYREDGTDATYCGLEERDHV